MRNITDSYTSHLTGVAVHELFEQQVNLTPDAIALRYGHQQLTYAELDEKANQLAHYLLHRGIQPESRIAISLERSPEMIIGLLGIIKAGAAYVPIDPHYPEERIRYMLTDCQANLLLTQAHLQSRFSFFKPIFCLDTDWSSLESFPTSKPVLKTDSQQLIYIIYTSGSTGQPKGVLVEHRSVVNLVAGQINRLQHPVNRFLYAYSFAFDGAVLLIYWTLLAGGTLVIAPENLEKDVQQLASFIRREGITHLLTFPSLYGLLLDQVSAEDLASLESVSVAGEACPVSLTKTHYLQVPQARLFNQYGPTEATVGATIYEVPRDLKGNKVPIGTCIDGVYIRLLDEQGQAVQPGTTGEIYIGGAGVARGYWMRQKLTTERFIKDPFSKNPRERLYRTGDLARRLPDGQLDFIGRADDQVKLRGYRIELGEVEALLNQHPAVREAIADIRGTTPEDQYLCCWWREAPDRSAGFAELRQFAARHLPDYMLPTFGIRVATFPKSASGKIDRKALSTPEKSRPELTKSYAPPRTALEKQLTELWEEILSINPIGIHDKFFELGGNSLQAARFIGEVQQLTGENVFIVTIFDHPTIASYANFLDKEYDLADKEPENDPSSDQLQKREKELSPEAFENFKQYVPGLPTIKSSGLKNPPALFILAPPRSGTTLLRVMLTGHPELFAANELQLLGFNTLSERAAAYQGKFSLWAEGLLRTIMELQACDAGQAKATVQKWIDQNWTTQQCFAQLQKWIGDRILIDKSPSYALDPLALKKAESDFDRPFYIHLLRHPYAMIRSFEQMHMAQAMYLRPHPYGDRSTGELIWTQSHQNILAFLQSIPPQRHFCLAYEDLVTQPEMTMRKLCDHFGWTFHEALVQPYRNLEQKMVDGIYQGSKPMGDIRLLEHRDIDPQLADKWQGVLRDNFLSKTTWYTAQSLGYPVIAKKHTSVPTTPTEQEITPRAHPPRTSIPPSPSDIAIVGMSCRFPGAQSPAEFWLNLAKGVDVSREFTEQDLIAAGLDPELIRHPDYVRRGMTLEDADCFDASFFGYLPKEAALMDPQHRIFLECAYAALEDAAYDPHRFDGRIGVFGGVARNTYLINNVITHPNYFQSLDDFQIGIALEKDFPATRVAYKLNLKGAAINVQTACSSSGVAIHLACQSLLNGDNELVLVGGGRIQPPLSAGHLHKDGHALSPDGYCRAFDAEAQGMVRGHGMACLVLKKLKDAIADGDNIHAVIKATAINNDGSAKIGFTAPSISGQAAAIRQAFERAGFSPETLSYVEAHGTGTHIGDPIEIAGLTKAFQQYTPQKQFCAIGSVKTNIGHLDAGACIAGIIKTVLAMKYGQLPANLHFRQPNPQIEFEKTPFYVNDQLRDWKRDTHPRRAGVSSFGLGGTNAHILLEEAPELNESPSEKSHQLLLLSAKTEEALDKQTQQLGKHLEITSQGLGDIAYTLQVGKTVYDHRRFLVCDDKTVAAEQCTTLSGPLVSSNGNPTDQAPKIIFLFPGGGAQHVNMGKALYEQEPAFRRALDECLELLKDNFSLELYKVLYPVDSPESNAPIHDPLQAITLLFCVEYATAQLWQSWGVQPDQMIGHSLGEYTAACIGGILSLEDALALVVKRGQLFQQLVPGAMLSVALPERDLLPLLDEELSLAAINKPDSGVVSGPVAAIDRFAKTLGEKGIDHQRLHISVAAHSKLVEPILPEFKVLLQKIDFGETQIPIISNLNGNWARGEELRSPEYWCQHLRQGVRFADGLSTLLQQENCILLEVGPGQTLSSFARQHPKKTKTHQVLASLRHPKEQIHDRAFILKTVGKLWLSNLSLNWSEITGRAHRRVSLPTYPFARHRHWIDPKPLTEASTPAPQPSSQRLPNPLPQPTMNTTAFSRKALIEEQLKELFHQMSGIPQSEIDTSATFLELGFDSLMLTQVTARLKKKYQIELSFRQLFESLPNIDQLADHIDRELPETALREELNSRQPQAKPSATRSPSAPISPIPPSPSSPDQASNLESIIQQQLQLMQRQLDLLGGQQITFPSPRPDRKDQPSAQVSINPDLKNGSAAKPVNPKSPVTKKEGLAHGPWKPISKKGTDGLTPQQRQYLDQLISRYTNKTKGSQQLTQAQRSYLADPRSITGFNRLWKDMVYQIAVERSKGAKIWDVDGNEYVDYRMAFGISLFGHTPDFVQRAIREQVEKGIELGVLTPLANKVAKLLAELSGMERVTFVNTGSEALSAAVRIARTATGKDRIAIFQEDYHGIADEFLVKRVGPAGSGNNLPVSPGIPQFLVDQVLVLKYDDPDISGILERHAHELAAIVIEPVQPNNPCHQPRELLQEIRRVTKEHDIAMIFDEMITGFRLAPRGAQEWYGIDVDIVAYGKIISGGLPMAAVAGAAKYMDCFDGGSWNFGDDSIPEKGVTFFGGTFVRHPLSLAAAYAALSQIKTQGAKLYENLNAKSARFAKQLKELFLRTKAPLSVQSTGSIVAIQPANKNPLAKLFFYYARMKGIHLTEKAALVSTAHTEADLQFTIRIFEECIREMQTAGFFPLTVAEVEDQNKIIYPPKKVTAGNSSSEKKKLPLTEGQQEVWVEQRLGNAAAAAYNLSSDFALEGHLQVEALEQALQVLVDRHESLRVYFSATTTTQVVLPTLKIPLQRNDLTGKSDSEQQHLLEKLRQAEVNTPIDIFEPPLLRAHLVTLSAQRHHLLLTVHHAVTDGWSWGILANELAELYSAKVEQRSPELEPPRQLHQFVEQLREFEGSEAFSKTEKYWVDQFKNGVPVLEFPTDRSRPAKKTYAATLASHHFDAALVSDLKRVAAKQGTTLFFLLYTAFQVFVHRLSRQDDFILGLVAAGQANGGNQNLVAHAANLLPIRTVTDPAQSFNQHLCQMRGHLLDAFEHQHYTLGALVKQLKLSRDPSRQPLISILFNMDTPSAPLHFSGLKVKQTPIPRGYETFDSFINLKPEGSSLIFEWIYNTDLFYAETIQRRLLEFETLLKSIATAPETCIHALSLLPKTEMDLLRSWQSEPNLDFPQKQCIHELFEVTASSYPHRVAVMDPTTRLSYAELNQQSDQVAQLLLNHGAGPGDFVGIYLQRSCELLVGLLATLKIGAIYVPLDPANPPARLQVILEDADARFLLTHRNMHLNGFDRTILSLDAAKSLKISDKHQWPKAHNQQFAYVNYTSGSSGRPKGALFSHYQVIDHHYAIAEALDLGENELFFNVASAAFDPSVQDFFLPLFLGGTVYISPEEEKTDGFQLRNALEKVKPTLMQATPSTWRMLLSAGWQGNEELRILCGGEGLNKELSNQLIARCQSLYNIYGPTETTIWSTLKKLEGNRLATQSESGYEPIGRPLRNVQLFLLDEHQQEVPIGVAGEIYIGGIGVAREGYFKRPSLSKDKFIPNPFSGRSGAMLYRTGDLGRYLANGDLEYLQRADRQVKIRGFRIELGEIEAAIAQHPDIQENVVVIREDQPGAAQLVAYFVHKKEKIVEREVLKQFLQQKLPAFMLPGLYVAMDAFPLTATLKIDRNQLPAPTTDQQDWKRPFEPAGTASEKLLHQIWQELLGIDQISIDDNFFDLGGHSLVAVKMMAQLKAHSGKELPLACLLEHATIRQLAQQLDRDQAQLKDAVRSLVPIRKTGTRTPLYLVHGAGLHVLMYETLARHMPEDQPIYALQARGLYGEAEPLDRIEDIATHYIEEILTQNPGGPYALAGYSFGGLIAFEMAKQLEARGKEVSLLGMFDTVVRQQITGSEQSSYYQQLADFGKKVTWNLGLLAKDPIANLKYKTNTLSRRWKRWRWSRNQEVQNLPNSPATNHQARVDQMNQKAFDQYRITPYRGEIHLFRATERRFYLDDFEFLGWKPFAQGGIIVHDVPGDHLNMFDPPQGAAFAKILQTALKNTVQRTASGETGNPK